MENINQEAPQKSRFGSVTIPTKKFSRPSSRSGGGRSQYRELEKYLVETLEEGDTENNIENYGTDAYFTPHTVSAFRSYMSRHHNYGDEVGLFKVHSWRAEDQSDLNENDEPRMVVAVNRLTDEEVKAKYEKAMAEEAEEEDDSEAESEEDPAEAMEMITNGSA